MSIVQIIETIKDYGRDTRLNLGSVLTEEGSAGLSKLQIWGVALASGYVTKNSDLISALTEDAGTIVTPEIVEAAKSAATIMGMNTVYYRFLHLSEDKEFSKLPARLRMNVIGKPGIPKVDFELMCLAVAALAGCGMCVNAHVAEVRKGGISNEGIQSSVRIASVLNATAQALSIG